VRPSTSTGACRAFLLRKGVGVGSWRRCGGMLAAISLVFTLVLAPCSAVLSQPTPLHSSVQLVAETTAVAPGKRTWIGLRFVMDTGWHIYWVNSGDSGQPPSVKWALPAGFHGGPMAWPVPERLGNGNVIDYGYEHQVLLIVPLQAPEDLRPNSRVRIGASVEWLVCRDICIPARDTVHLELPVASHATLNRSTAIFFRQTRARLPIEQPRGWRVVASDAGDTFLLTVLTGRTESAALFFPFHPDQVDNAAKQVVRPVPRGVRLTLKKSDLLAKRVKVLTGVLELTNGRAYWVSTPVRGSAR
jgi:DsbC/DsbD-like thiol-disulfide interchange protein